MPGLARGRTIAIREHRDQRSLHHRSISSIEPRVRAEPSDSGIRKCTLRRGQESSDFGLIGDVCLELSDAKEIV